MPLTPTRCVPHTQHKYTHYTNTHHTSRTTHTTHRVHWHHTHTHTHTQPSTHRLFWHPQFTEHKGPHLSWAYELEEGILALKPLVALGITASLWEWGVLPGLLQTNMCSFLYDFWVESSGRQNRECLDSSWFCLGSHPDEGKNGMSKLVCTQN